MDDQTSDDTSTPLMSDKEFADFAAGRNWPTDLTKQGNLILRASAEMNRRLMRAQVNALEAQRQQLESQGRQNEGQLEVAKSLSRATWWLSCATAVLAVSTIVLTIVTAFHW
jgi:hypothetical protein